MKIAGCKQEGKYLEYLIHFSDKTSSEDARASIFHKITKSFLKDYEGFVIGSNRWILASDSPKYLQINDPIKNNLSAIVRLDDSLSENYKFLRIFSKDLDKIESLYGDPVRTYIDNRVKRAFS